MIFDDPDTVGLEPDARLDSHVALDVGGMADAGASHVASMDVDVSGKTPATLNAAHRVSQAGRSSSTPPARSHKGLGIHLDRAPSVVQVRGDVARLLSVVERTRYLFGKDAKHEQPAEETRESRPAGPLCGTSGGRPCDAPARRSS